MRFVKGYILDMKKETYIKITGLIRDDERKIKLIRVVNRLLTGFVFLLYPLFLLLLLIQRNPFFIRAVLVPAISFVAVSVFRHILNVPRPYEKFEIAPAIEKETHGKSFPSRHVFSVFVIAMTIFYVYTNVGILLCIIGILLGIIRVIGGVHEPRDIIAGALIGILSGLVGFYLF